jgi:hypothetical protein
LKRVQVDNSTGNIEYGTYNTTEMPETEAGILMISYQQGESIGSVVLPWGFGTLGASSFIGGDQTDYTFVATELRQVRINQVSYSVKLSTWSLRH